MNKAEANVAAPTVGSKRNAEGNITNHNSFSVLDNDIVMNLSNLMGVKVTENDFSTIDLLAEMENARLLLHQKNVSQNSVFNQEVASSDPLNIDNASNCTDCQDITSDLDEYVLVSPKRNRKPSRKIMLSSSNNKKKDKQNRETLCKMRGGKTQGNSEAPNEPLKRKNNVKKKS